MKTAIFQLCLIVIDITNLESTRTYSTSKNNHFLACKQCLFEPTSINQDSGYLLVIEKYLLGHSALIDLKYSGIDC